MARGSIRATFSNWARSDLSLAEKIRLSTKNTAYKIKNGTSCCGNHGEPGC